MPGGNSWKGAEGRREKRGRGSGGESAVVDRDSGVGEGLQEAGEGRRGREGGEQGDHGKGGGYMYVKWRGGVN